MEDGIIRITDTRSYLKLFLFEYIGTAIFLLGINYSGGQGYIVASSIFIAAILTGRIGGAHFNGGVTLAVYIVEGKWRKNISIAGTVWIADILGAYTGIGVACFL
jgi:glycerol uptake facilitator-like aquaporin